jgi:hypothetical protein
MDEGAVLRVTDLLLSTERHYASQLDTLLQVFWIPAMTLGVIEAEQMPALFGKYLVLLYHL